MHHDQGSADLQPADHSRGCNRKRTEGDDAGGSGGERHPNGGGNQFRTAIFGQEDDISVIGVTRTIVLESAV
jgi:hypothetical protein